MRRRTSIEAYKTIQQNGLLGKRQMQAYDILYEFGPLTSNRLWEVLKTRDGLELSSHGAGSRLSELREMGVVAEVGEAIDPITNMRVILWDVTDQLPMKLPKKESRDEIIERQAKRIAELEQEVARVKSLLPRQRDMFGH